MPVLVDQVAEVDSFLRAHQRYGRRPLSPEEADQYVNDMAEVAIRLGSDVPPRLAVVPAARLLVGTLGWATGGSPFREAALERVGA